MQECRWPRYSTRRCSGVVAANGWPSHHDPCLARGWKNCMGPNFWQASAQILASEIRLTQCSTELSRSKRYVVRDISRQSLIFLPDAPTSDLSQVNLTFYTRCWDFFCKVLSPKRKDSATVRNKCYLKLLSFWKTSSWVLFVNSPQDAGKMGLWS